MAQNGATAKRQLVLLPTTTAATADAYEPPSMARRLQELEAKVLNIERTALPAVGGREEPAQNETFDAVAFDAAVREQVEENLRRIYD